MWTKIQLLAPVISLLNYHKNTAKPGQSSHFASLSAWGASFILGCCNDQEHRWLNESIKKRFYPVITALSQGEHTKWRWKCHYQELILSSFLRAKILWPIRKAQKWFVVFSLTIFSKYLKTDKSIMTISLKKLYS